VYSRFYLSLQDELLRRFSSERMQGLFSRLGLKDDNAIEHKLISRSVEGAQKRVEGNNFDNRKTLLQYDDVIRLQREIMYAQRKEILTEVNIRPIVDQMFRRAIENIVYQYAQIDNIKDQNPEAIVKYFNSNIFGEGGLTDEEIASKTGEQIVELINQKAKTLLDEKEQSIEPEIFHEFLKVVVLRIVDMKWTNHIDIMDGLRQSIGLQAYGQINPLHEYQTEGFELFENMTAAIADDVLKYILRAQIQMNLKREEVAKPTQTSSGKEEIKKKPVTSDKVGRNDLCPCGSGKKYKHCCGQ
jgi:preprotein translocase subunit SecA